MTRLRALAILLLATLLAVGCASRKPPVVRPPLERAGRTPVVLLPGITGSKLRERDSGRVAWGRTSNLLRPRDGGYSLAVPIVAGPDREDPIESFEPVLGFRFLGIFRLEFYSKMVRAMESNGYRTGNLRNPRPDETFFIFDYDWRHSNVRAARELGEALERLRRVRGEEVLHVHLICQSNASRIARYFLKYGGVSLEDAESGKGRPPALVRVDKLIFVGAENGGAVGTLHTLDRARTYVPIVGRRFLPETMFTFESLFETLPAYTDDLFFGEDGKRLEVPLFEAESWQRYGWSVFGEHAERRIRESGRRDLFGDEEDRVRYLRRVLDRAVRMHRLLMRDVAEFGDARYYYVQNAYRPTDQRAMLKREPDGGWRTCFLEDSEVKRNPYLFTLAATAGDGYATVDSQLWVSPQERAATAHPPVYVPVRHRNIIRDRAAHRWILEFLAEP